MSICTELRKGLATKEDRLGKETFHIADFKNTFREYLYQKLCVCGCLFLSVGLCSGKVHSGVTVSADAN